MQKLIELTEQIRKLSPDEFAELREWILEQDWKLWDARIETDAQSGKLDELISEGMTEYKSGWRKEL